LKFVEQQREALVIAGLVVVFLAGLSALLFAPTIVQPIQHIALRSRALANGEYSATLSISRPDEIGDLARDINELARTLDKNETLRQRWLADTSHEIRTPLAIIKGEIEAMLDGVRPINREQLTSLAHEVNHLTKLIDDLADLASADVGSLRYRKQAIRLTELLLSSQPRFQHLCDEAELKLHFESADDDLLIWADKVRINQMLDNLITNSCKYTDAPGELHIKVAGNIDSVQITIEDSSPGVPDEALNRLFEHLFRVESSRNRKTGDSGLGLAIALRIVEGHEGTIQAMHSAFGGLKLTISLPLYEPQ
jgi:two-component system sensor histidine kinase BaeS